MDRVKNCENPDECAQTVEMIIKSLTPKFHPLNDDSLSITPQRLRENKKAIKEEGIITFNPTICNITNLEACFRVFMNSKSKCRIPA